MQRQFSSPAYGLTTIDAVVLPEGSFFGEFPVMLNIKCFFTMKVAQKARSKKQIERDGCQMALIYELEADTFREIVKDYPKYSNNLLIRGELRTAYFKYLTNLKQSEFAYKMKIIEIEKHIIAGIRGRYLEEDEII